MDEVVIGDILGRLKIDSSEYVRGMQQAEQALQRFQQQTAQHAASLNQAMTPARGMPSAPVQQAAPQGATRH